MYPSADTELLAKEGNCEEANWETHYNITGSDHYEGAGADGANPSSAYKGRSISHQADGWVEVPRSMEAKQWKQQQMKGLWAQARFLQPAHVLPHLANREPLGSSQQNTSRPSSVLKKGLFLCCFHHSTV